MGVTPSSKQIHLVDQLYENLIIPELAELEKYALSNRPEIQIAHMKIQQYKDTISLERAKIFKVVDIGLAYKQDFDKPFRGWGPYIDIQLPIFDTNYAQIARAEFLLKQAEKELLAEKFAFMKRFASHIELLRHFKRD